MDSFRHSYLKRLPSWILSSGTTLDDTSLRVLEEPLTLDLLNITTTKKNNRLVNWVGITLPVERVSQFDLLNVSHGRFCVSEDKTVRYMEDPCFSSSTVPS